MQDPRVATGLVIEDEHDNILLQRKADDARMGPGTWDIPGGKLDPGETLSSCAKREAGEEVGIDAEVERLNVITEDLEWGPELHFVTHYFRTRKWTGTPRLMEPQKHVALRWISREDLQRAVDEPSADLPLFGPLVDAIRNGLLEELAAS